MKARWLSMRKEKEKKILPTLKFMLKTAVKNKPQLFIAYALQVVVSFSQTMVNIISFKNRRNAVKSTFLLL